MCNVGGFFSNIAANSSADNYDLVIIPEGDGYNNTLSGSCPNGDTEEGYVPIPIPIPIPYIQHTKRDK